MPLAMQYLLSCPCGEKVPVTRAQAGLSITCQCGKQLSVPTVRGLSELEPVGDTASAPATARRPWGPRQSVLSLGVVIFASAVIAIIVLVQTRPPNPARRLAEESMQGRAPVQLLNDWRYFRDNEYSVDTGRTHKTMLEYANARTRNIRWLAIAAGVGLIGLVVFIAGFFVPAGRARA